MRSIPVDLSRCALIGTGKCSAKMAYAQLSDGSTRATGEQARDESTGMPLWVVDVLVEDDDARRAEVVGVTVPSYDEPVTPKYRPVAFRNVTATIYTDRSTNRAMVSMRAEGIEPAAKSQPAA